MRFKNVVLAAAATMALPLAAQAQPVTGLYVGAGVGGNYYDARKRRHQYGKRRGDRQR